MSLKLDTDYPADSVEFCSARGSEDVLVCGTYKLLEGTGPEITEEYFQSGESTNSPSTPASRKRIGKCILLRVSQEKGDEKLSNLQEIDMPAILDMKWRPHSNLLAIADSEGHIALHELNLDRQLCEIQKIQCRPTDILCLSIDWSNRRTTNEAGSLVVSCSDGSLSLLCPDGSGVLSELHAWHAHDYEAWIAAWNYWNTNVIYSGGDDLKMKGWDVRQDLSTATFVNKRPVPVVYKFDAGVTSIQSHPHKEHILAVGSYDATVRIFDTRKPLVPITQAEVGGGAWRVKWHPSASRSTDLLVACMHDGFKVIRFAPSTFAPDTIAHDVRHDELDVVKHFDAHESLAYGVDWAHKMDDAGETLIASCSFYDHVLYTWKG